MSDFGARFLSERYPELARSSEVLSASRRTSVLTRKPFNPAEFIDDYNDRVSKIREIADVRERVKANKKLDEEALIQNYLDRFKKILDRKNPSSREIGVKALKRILVKRYVIREADIPDAYLKTKLAILDERGTLGDNNSDNEELQAKIMKEHVSQLIADQQASLEQWVDYLASDRSSYLPDYLKYWVFAGILKLEVYKKTTGTHGSYPERPSGRQRSVKMFPEINEAGLIFIAKAYEQLNDTGEVYFGYNSEIPKNDAATFVTDLSTKKFRDLYGWVQKYVPPITEEEMKITDGEGCGWKTYSSKLGSTGNDVSDALIGKGTGWCIVGSSVAQKTYLDNNSTLHIYFTRAAGGKKPNPRLVIVERDGKLMEVRGIGWHENLDNHILQSPIIKKKLEEFPNGDKFLIIENDARTLAGITQKIQRNEELIKEEIMFLYEINRPIQFFGEKRDPRIDKMRMKRDSKRDVSIIYDCDSSQIAHDISEINGKTKVYIGNIEPTTLKKLIHLNVEHIYTSFPTSKCERYVFSNDTLSSQQIIDRVSDQDLGIDDSTRAMILRLNVSPSVKIRNFVKQLFSKASENDPVEYIQVKVSHLSGENGEPAINELVESAKESGLEPCLPEDGVYFYLKNGDKIKNELIISMNPLTLKEYKGVFYIMQYQGRKVLTCSIKNEYKHWHKDTYVLFRIPKRIRS